MSKRTEISTLGEFGLIRHLTENIEIKHPSTIKGIGDDGYSLIAVTETAVQQCCTCSRIDNKAAGKNTVCNMGLLERCIGVGIALGNQAHIINRPALGIEDE